MARFDDSSYIIHYNSELKKILITGLRCGSSFCYVNLTPERGWKQVHIDGIKPSIDGIEPQPDALTFSDLIAKAQQGYDFYCMSREPQCRLTSGMEMISRPTKEQLDGFTNFEIFSNILTLTVTNNAASDIENFGYARYTMTDPHLGWGTHTLALFLEALGIEVMPLDLRYPFSSFPRDLQITDFNKFIAGLEYDVIKPGANAGAYTETDKSISSDRFLFRSNRFYNWLQTCTKFMDSAKIVRVPDYTVFDWLEADNIMYANFLGMDSCNSRPQAACQTLTKVMDNMWSKLKVDKIFQSQRPGSYIRCESGSYPCNNFFTILYQLMPLCTQQNLLPDIFDLKKYPELNMFSYPGDGNPGYPGDGKQ